MVSSWVLKALGFTTIVYTVALTIGSLIKPVRIDTSINNIDKFLHTGAYFGLALLWLSLYHLIKRSASKQWSPKRFYMLIVIGLVLYGIMIEILQGSLTDYRTADVWDVLANSIGIVLGSLCFVLFFKNFMRLKTTN